MNRLPRTTAALLLALLCTATSASDLRAFHDALADAWRFYRSATFYLRTGNTMVAGFELEQLGERWQSLRTVFEKQPPDAYADDPRFGEVLANGQARIGTAVAAAAAGDAERAAAELAPLRGELSSLRARAGVRTFSDCVDETNAAMDALYVYRSDLPALTDAAVVNDIRSKAAVYRYLLARCDAEAKETVRANEEFRRLVDVSLASVAQLFDALDRRDATAVVNILRELRSADRLLFLNFG